MYTCTEHSVTIHSILRLWVFNLKNKQNKQEKKNKKKLFYPKAQVQNQPSHSSKRLILTSLCKESNQVHQCSATGHIQTTLPQH